MRNLLSQKTGEVGDRKARKCDYTLHMRPQTVEWDI